MLANRYNDSWLFPAAFFAPAAFNLAVSIVVVYPRVGLVIGSIVGALCIRSIVRRLNRQPANPPPLRLQTPRPIQTEPLRRAAQDSTG